MYKRQDTSLTGKTPPLIKRVIALEHDKIEVKAGQVFLNDQVLEEPFIKAEEILDEFESFVVPKGHIFVMGDNRNNSKDSRYIGPVRVDRLIGRAEVIIFPPNRITSFNFPQ